MRLPQDGKIVETERQPVMDRAQFLIYGCPYTAFAVARECDAFVVPEPDSGLYHYRRNVNRIVNLVRFSRAKNIRLIGCSPQFIEQFNLQFQGLREPGFHVSYEPRAAATFDLSGVTGVDSPHAIVVENKPKLFPIAHQLARAVGARIIAIDPLSEEEAATFSASRKDFEDGAGLAREDGLETCKALIRKKLGVEFFREIYSSVTFITQFPLNFYPLPYPTGHLPARAAGELAVAGILKSEAPSLRTGVAVILDSGRTTADIDSEYVLLHNLLRSSRGVLPACGPATLGDFRWFVEDMPTDLIFLAAHCGRMPMIELKATFSYKGKACQVRYAVDRGVSADSRIGRVDCLTTYLPIEVNGVAWGDKHCDRRLFVEFSKNEMDASLGKSPRNPEFTDISITEVDAIQNARSPGKCLGSNEGQHFVPLMNSVGGYYFPLVFNNSCASYSGVCDEFVPDASFYVGTSRPIDSFSAVEVVSSFAQGIARMPVGRALYEAQQGFIRDHTPYLLAGVPWLSMPDYQSSALAIMRANALIKELRSGSHCGDAWRDYRGQVFREEQRRLLLKQLFPPQQGAAISAS